MENYSNKSREELLEAYEALVKHPFKSKDVFGMTRNETTKGDFGKAIRRLQPSYGNSTATFVEMCADIVRHKSLKLVEAYMDDRGVLTLVYHKTKESIEHEISLCENKIKELQLILENGLKLTK
jgi:hypothetical protein